MYVIFIRVIVDIKLVKYETVDCRRDGLWVRFSTGGNELLPFLTLVTR